MTDAANYMDPPTDPDDTSPEGMRRVSLRIPLTVARDVSEAVYAFGYVNDTSFMRNAIADAAHTYALKARIAVSKARNDGARAIDNHGVVVIHQGVSRVECGYADNILVSVYRVTDHRTNIQLSNEAGICAACRTHLHRGFTGSTR